MVYLGPVVGLGGGYVVAEGTPEKVAAAKKGYTSKYLREYIEELASRRPRDKRKKTKS
jgi:excinuclease ABC subunit A